MTRPPAGLCASRTDQTGTPTSGGIGKLNQRRRNSSFRGRPSSEAECDTCGSNRSPIETDGILRRSRGVCCWADTSVASQPAPCPINLHSPPSTGSKSPARSRVCVLPNRIRILTAPSSPSPLHPLSPIRLSHRRRNKPSPLTVYPSRRLRPRHASCRRQWHARMESSVRATAGGLLGSGSGCVTMPRKIWHARMARTHGELIDDAAREGMRTVLGG